MGPSPPLLPSLPELDQERLTRGLAHIRLRAAHLRRRAAKPSQGLILHPGKSGAKGINIEKGFHQQRCTWLARIHYRATGRSIVQRG
jgi:hypothetical protein